MASDTDKLPPESANELDKIYVEIQQKLRQQRGQKPANPAPIPPEGGEPAPEVAVQPVDELDQIYAQIQEKLHEPPQSSELDQIYAEIQMKSNRPGPKPQSRPALTPRTRPVDLPVGKQGERWSESLAVRPFSLAGCVREQFIAQLSPQQRSQLLTAAESALGRRQRVLFETLLLGYVVAGGELPPAPASAVASWQELVAYLTELLEVPA
ncbi:hypothetical protein [Gloeobacter kilaueensis]|uniref:Uncharacterized protein n=1 Tax=Gloeobacter kilaueensis (strain ATCC BAA-2537 / CCAP 1431/1 / ULC 316 / JS1) TaxID=1183438 RepID=U5QG13_GLOK1|nr:hypothetical protein [Gloeobacter kilaueensis]AGY56620.1 hypothetical protein GKIL_0373 [Gloeobacter kilaueensis JS1]